MAGNQPWQFINHVPVRRPYPDDMWNDYAGPIAVNEYLRLLFDVHANDRIIGYEDSQLENKYPDFRNLVREYREGILLFDLTQEVVWDKAAKDSLGIYNHYEKVKFDFS